MLGLLDALSLFGYSKELVFIKIMRNILSSKKLLLLALLEDVVVIFFLFSIIASSLEILLPNILAQRIPLALIFTAFTILAFLYLRTLQKESLPLPVFSVPSFLKILVFIFLILIGLFMTRAFGIWGAFAQVALLSVTLWYWFKK